MGRTGQREVTAAPGRPRFRDALAAPNVLSLLRLALVPAALWLLSAGERGWTAFVLLLMAATDGLDGYVARRTGRVTELGKILDPLADKVAVDAVLLALALRGEFPAWALSVIVARDLGIAVAAAFMARRVGGVPASDAVGKLTFVILAAMTVAFAVDVRALETPLLVTGLAMVVVSSVSYGRRTASVLATTA